MDEEQPTVLQRFQIPIQVFFESSTGRRVGTPVWVFIVLAGLVSFFVFLLRVVYRRFQPDPDYLGFIATVAECTSVLSVGSLLLVLFGLTKKREEQFEHWLEQTIHSWRARIVIAGVVLSLALVMVVVWHVGLPYSARIHNNRSVQLLRDGHTSEAIEQLQIAVSLNPDYPQAHINLGRAYERFLDFDRAIGEYQIALEQDASLDVAYINLGHLYLQHRDDYENAIAILRAGESLVQDDVRHILYKNLGWAHCQKGLYNVALADLERAVELEPDYDEAFALMAQVYAALGDEEAARNAWENVLRYAPPDSEQALIARSRLQSSSFGFDTGRCVP